MPTVPYHAPTNSLTTPPHISVRPQEARKAALAEGGTALLAGAAGNKLLMVAEGRADMAIMHLKTSLWDTCAPEAILRASGN